MRMNCSIAPSPYEAVSTTTFRCRPKSRSAPRASKRSIRSGAPPPRMANTTGSAGWEPASRASQAVNARCIWMQYSTAGDHQAGTPWGAGRAGPGWTNSTCPAASSSAGSPPSPAVTASAATATPPKPGRGRPYASGRMRPLAAAAIFAMPSCQSSCRCASNPSVGESDITATSMPASSSQLRRRSRSWSDGRVGIGGRPGAWNTSSRSRGGAVRRRSSRTTSKGHRCWWTS